ncbi:MAG: phenylalanine--tRNA ligase subunit alpha [Thermoplasmatota archaeon]
MRHLSKPPPTGNRLPVTNRVMRAARPDTFKSRLAVPRIVEELSANEKRVLKALGELGGQATPDEIMSRAGLDATQPVMNASSWLQQKGLVRHEETMRTFIALGRSAGELVDRKLPERRALEAALASAVPSPAGAIPSPSSSVVVDSLGLAPAEISVALGWLKRKGLAEIAKDAASKTTITITDAGRRHAHAPTHDEAVLARLFAEKEVPEGELDAEGLKLLFGRQNLVRKREEITRIIHLTEKGRRVVEKGIEIKEEVSQLTPELIGSGKWRDVDIRPYDVTAFAPVATGGKKHPLRQVIDDVRAIFLEMGFSEIEGPFVRSAFWNLDALFIPQNHPAREMQDTFYVARPERVDLAGEPLRDKVKAMHEHGGETGSTGWRAPWSEDVASQLLLRTHTTPDTLNYLANHHAQFANGAAPPVRIFSVDRVFRNEAIDATHLPEFHQVEGVVVEEGANLRMLLGFLKGFYAKMGFPQVRVRPAYFPYTEPSLEVEVFYNNRWMELGGAGIFRREVVEPLGIDQPVLAWGLGLERIAMMRLGLKDLRELYVSDVEWLRNAPLQ